MKDRPLVFLSLVLSVAALGYTAWLHQRAEMFAAEALRRRESELVRAWAPKFDEIYRDMLPDAISHPKSPTTLAELFDPLVRLMGQVGELSDPTNAAPTNPPIP